MACFGEQFNKTSWPIFEVHVGFLLPAASAKPAHDQQSEAFSPFSSQKLITTHEHCNQLTPISHNSLRGMLKMHQCNMHGGICARQRHPSSFIHGLSTRMMSHWGAHLIGQDSISEPSQLRQSTSQPAGPCSGNER